jgi:hypothetical protein
LAFPTPVTITNVDVTSNVLTVTSAGGFSTFAGSYVSFSGLSTAVFLNGKTVYCPEASATTITCTFTNADYPSAADTGTASIQTSSNPTPYYADVAVTKPGGSAIGVEADPSSSVLSPNSANKLTGFYSSAGAISSRKSLYAYGVDIAGFPNSLGTRESANFRSEIVKGSPGIHDYAYKAEKDTQGSPGFYAYQNGDVYTRGSVNVVTGTTLGACTQTVGIGLWDCTVAINAAGGGAPQSETVKVKVCTTGTIDSFDWSTTGVPDCVVPISMSASGTPIGDDIKITWAATTGHTVGDTGSIAVTVATTNVSSAATTRTAAVTVLAPVVGDSGLILVLNPPTPVHLTRLFCAIQGSTNVVVNLDKRTEGGIASDSGNHLLGADLTAITTGANTSTFANGAGQCGSTSSCAVGAYIPVVMTFTSVSATPSTLQCSLDYTLD